MFRRRAHPRTQFQILSDLHLEFGQQYPTYEIPVKAPYLVLAGDIGRLIDTDGYSAFLARQCRSFQLVFLVLGNHEFYKSSRADGLRIAQELEISAEMQGKLVLLNRTRYDVDERTVILGCTLNSDIPPAAEEIVSSSVQDFKQIDSWTVESHNAFHRVDVEWLKGNLQRLRQDAEHQKQQKNILVITHHAPLIKGTSAPIHEGSAINSAFATDVFQSDDERELWQSINTWIFGHTHYSTQFQHNGVRLLANQRGYVFEFEKETQEQAKETGWAFRYKEWLVQRSAAKDRHTFDVGKVVDMRIPEAFTHLRESCFGTLSSLIEVSRVAKGSSTG